MEKSILKKIILIIILNAFIILLLTVKSNAASLSISTSKSTVAPGESFTVTVKLNNGAGYVTSEGQTQWLDNSSFSYTKTAGSSGSVTVTASGTAADYSTEKDQKVSASKTVKIVKPTSSSGGNSSGNSGGNSSGGSTGGNSGNKPTTTTKPPEEVKKSTDNTLSTLSIAEGQISPEFNNDIKEYALTVPYEVTELNVTATPNDSKAKVEIIGDKDLQEGENILTIRVTAEDGSVADYVVKVTKARIPLALKSLVIKYQNENGELVETALNPAFSFDVFEYSLEEMEYWVEKLSVEALPNIEGASIDIQGADNLQAGENTVTITAKIPKEVAEGEEPKEEIITYTIKLNKKPEPTTMERLSDWYNQNEEYVIIGALGVCVVFLFGLSIYIIVDHNKYKHIIARVKEENDFKSNKIFEEVSEEASEEKDNIKTGKRFK